MKVPAKCTHVNRGGPLSNPQITDRQIQQTSPLGYEYVLGGTPDETEAVVEEEAAGESK